MRRLRQHRKEQKQLEAQKLKDTIHIEVVHVDPSNVPEVIESEPEPDNETDIVLNAYEEQKFNELTDAINNCLFTLSSYARLEAAEACLTLLQSFLVQENTEPSQEVLLVKVVANHDDKQSA